MASKEIIRQHLAQSSTINLDVTPVPKGDEARKMKIMEHLRKSQDQKR
ncbi:hypothetical protein [Lyngbya confervoides]|uniref:Uncharacterized protein n=1 Tax=Lyngbya confervoides BDU141951 TaxID=1574623 RepID=A0ABD4SZZ6_9CYAN|nr:hypothetical protein [Lyngbya confervoides]MCM1981854.1 hypothetical protein [Lyngbya confervoides BDU141951]